MKAQKANKKPTDQEMNQQKKKAPKKTKRATEKKDLNEQPRSRGNA